MNALSERLAALSGAKRALLHKVLATGHQGEEVIPRRPVGAPSPLSFAQQRLWFLDQLEGPSATYNMPNAVRLEGPLNIPALEAVFREIVRRHEALRTNFTQVHGKPVQVIQAPSDCSLPLVDVQALPEAEREAEVRRLAEREARQPFDLVQDRLLRVSLLRLAPECHVLLINMHHIISDGWSIGNVLIREFIALYEAFTRGEASPLPELPIQYADFACWQREWLHGSRLAPQLDYWQGQLADVPTLLEFPTDRPRPPVQTFQGRTHYFEIDAALVERLKALGQACGTTLFMTLLAGFAAVLSRYSRQDTFVVGSPIANRRRQELEPLIGFFVNTLVLRMDLSGQPDGRELLARVRKTCLEAYRHQDVPFERLVEVLQPQRNLSFSPLFQVMFILQNQNERLDELQVSGLTLSLLELEAATSMFDMTLKLEETGRGLAGELEYNTDLFDAATMARCMAHYRTLLASLTAHPDLPVPRLPLLHETERRQLLTAWNETRQVYPRERTVHGLFAARATLHPERIALVCGDVHLTYGQLNERANLLAAYLRGLQIGPEGLVGLCVTRSVDMVVGLLGILKAGAAYVPLDPSYPTERLALMIEDAGLEVLLTQESTATALPTGAARHIYLDRDWDAIVAAASPHPDRSVRPDNLAYVLYTSGSTGTPKGVQVSHAALLNFLMSMQQEPGLDEPETLLAVTTISFDIAALEIYLPLIVGARVALVSRETAADGFALLAAMREAGATVMQATPATWRLLLATAWPGPPLRRLFCGGEVLSRELAAQLLARGAEVWNLYGPTETTIWSTATRVTAHQPVAGAPDAREAIGRPIGNTQVYILDRDFQPVPVGVAGELYIGGAGVSRGYGGRPAMTAERFLPDPFAAAGARLYKTGDLARFLPDGRIDFLGRLDHQIKMRGFRIELGEIEAVLEQHPAVTNAVALCREDQVDHQQLVAYLQMDPSCSWASHDATAPGAIQVDKWHTVWDQIYREAAPPPVGSFDTSGWRSSYTGTPIPATDMRAWVDDTVGRILALRPRRVLEIGCGTGLLLCRLAPHVHSYVGTDFSESVLSRLRSLVQVQGMAGVTLRRRTASEFERQDTHAFDTVIVNSVVQYFPGVDYLLAVVEGAVNAVADGGSVFLGDLRALPLLEVQHASVQFYQAADLCTREDLRRQVASHMEREEELLIDPRFFHALQARLPRIGTIEILLKRGKAANEMAKFRYDVVLRIGPADAAQARAPLCLEALQEPLTLEDLHRLLARQGPETLLVRDLLNQRLVDDVRVLEWLSERAGPDTVGAMRALLQEEPAVGIEPEAIWALGASLGYSVGVCWSGEEPMRRFDAVFQRTGEPVSADIAVPISPVWHEASPLAWERYGNDPVQGLRQRALVAEIRPMLEARLPAYMIPSHIICMERFPLTPNGKIDRRALPAPDLLDLAARYSAPQTSIEAQLAEIWEQILGVQRVGRHDNFFGLGGHSLLAIQVISRIRDLFALELPIQALFDAPTVSLLAARLAAAPAEPRPLLPPIQARSRQDRTTAPLSFAQQRLWFLDRLEGTSVTYHISGAVRMTGPLDVSALERTFTAIVRRHEVLRTTFTEQDETPVQTITPPAPLPLQVVHLDTLPASAQALEITTWMEAENARAFDISRDCLLRVTLLRLEETTHLLLMTMHHIIADEWSIGVLLQEFSYLYAAFVRGEPSPLPELPIQYADYAHWQRQWLSGARLGSQLAYWRERLAGAPAVLDLPTDRPRPQVQRYRGRTHAFRLDATLTDRLKELGRASEATLFMTLLGGFAVLLARYSGQADLVIGSPMANRNRGELETLIGFFVNTLALRIDLGGNPTVQEVLARMRHTALEAYDHQDVPFEQLVEELRPERSLSYAPLFQVMFVLQNAPMPDFTLTGLRLETVDPESVAAKFDLTLAIEEVDGGLSGIIEYNTDLFDETTILRLSEHYRIVLTGMVAAPECRVLELPLMSESERHRVLVTWNETRRASLPQATMHRLFEAQVDRTPDQIAITYEDETLTYAALNRRANRVARQLQALGSGPDVLVGIYMEPSLDMIVGLLGILKAGSAYVPLVPTSPRERLAFMLEQTHVPIVLTQTGLAADLPETPAQILCLDTLLQGTAPDGNLEELAAPGNLAYIIYTSGSTGQPKGVLVTHANLLHSIHARLTYYEAPITRLLLLQPFGFDVAAGAIFWTLCQGGCLSLEPRELVQDPQRLLARLVQTQTSHLIILPLLYGALLDLATPEQLAALRVVIVGGELWPAPLAAQHGEMVPQAPLFNEYGPTEATIWSSVFRIETGSTRHAFPIGRPIPNTRILLLDPHHHPVPVGVPGELYIGGAQVTRGYLGDAALSAEKFLPDPYAEVPGARWYRTGDLARYQADGNIEFLGRIDQQVKIRGFRIEPGEIEAILHGHPDIREAVVVAQEDQAGRPGGAKRLVAYLVCAGEQAPGMAALRAYLQARLPDYMVPAALVFLEALPLTPHGKLDRRALPAPDRDSRATAYVAPRTPTETLLTTIWEEVLGCAQVGIHDNFFELGGDSILSIQIVSRAGRAGLGLTVKQLFQHQTVAALAGVAPARQVVHADQGMVCGPVPLTPIQRWFFEGRPPEPHHFNQALLLKTVAGLDPDRLAQALHHLLLHHDSLRSRCRWTDGQPQMEIAGSNETIPFTVRDFSGYSDEAARRALAADAAPQQATLDLERGPLLRVTFYRLGGGAPDRLLLILHHLVVDGVSWRILLSDLETAYTQLGRGEPVCLPPKTTSFKYWAERLEHYAHSQAATAELGYWREQGATLTPPLPLDTTSGTDANTMASADHITLGLSAEMTRALLQETPRAYNTQINDVLLTALVQAWASWTGNSALRLILEGHGREELFDEVDLSRTVGWFTTAFPVVLRLVPGEEPGRSLQRVKETLRAIPAHGIGYGLLRYLSPDTALREALGADPEAEVSFNYLGRFAQEARDSIFLGLASEPIGSDHSQSGRRRHLLEINGMLNEGQLQVTWTYSTNLHQRQTVERLGQAFCEALETIISHCRSAVAGGYTVSDFPLAPLAEPLLALLFRRWGKRVVDVYPLSPMQQGMLFHSLYEHGSGVYVVQLSCRVEGALQPEAWRHAWQQVVDRHPTLRTLVLSDGGADPLQVVLDQVALPWRDLDWREYSAEEQQERLEDFLRADRVQGFALDEPPLLRCALLRLEASAWQFVWSHHHLLTDGWCLPILMREVFTFYAAYTNHRDIVLDSPRPFRDYIAWLGRQDLTQAEAFWRDTLRGFTAPTAFGVDRVPAQIEAGAALYKEHTLYLDPETSAALQRLAQTHRLTLNVLVQGAWAVLLSRYSGETDVLFGATVAGRPPEIAGVDAMVGLFINTLPVRVHVDGGQSLLAFLTTLRDAQVARDAYAYTPLVEIQAWSDVPARQPLFESIVVFENYPMDESLGEQERALTFRDLQLLEQTNFPLTLSAAPAARLPLKIAYDSVRFEADTMVRMLTHLHNLLLALVAAPQQTVATWSMLDAEERQRLLVAWNQTRRESPERDTTVPELFEAQVRRTPSRIAVVFEEQQLTYDRLNRRANQLAHSLVTLGVGPGVLVGLYMERSLDMLVSLLGIQKAGGAYVPLDPAYPSERLAFMLHDAQVAVILTQRRLLDALPRTAAHLLCLDGEWENLAHASAVDPDRVAGPEDLAYVIYTSGSTGEPKGVQITQRALVNFLTSMRQQPGLSEQDVLLAVTTISFDIAALELYLPLLVGARVALVSREVAADGFRLLAELAHVGASVMQATPATWRLLLAAGWAGAPLARAWCGGEALPRDLATHMVERGVEVWNLYGPTETTIWSALHRVTRPGSGEVHEPIGRPIANTRFYVVDRHHHPVPVGVPGALLIAGDGLARGYLGRPGLTAERFIPDAFGEETGTSLYRTGDLVRYDADGSLVFLGRLDHQVKIRGFRIELGEIEAILHARPEVKQAVVTMWEAGPDDKRLVAYVVTENGSRLDEATVRAWLQLRLPPYMIPAYLVFLDSFPLTPNGKLDRRALPVPHRQNRATYVAPRTPTEAQLAAMVAEILSMEQVGIHDDFFELGGHSLLATRLVSRIQHGLQVTVPMSYLFREPTINGLADYIDTNRWAAQQGTAPATILEDDQEEIRL